MQRTSLASRAPSTLFGTVSDLKSLHVRVLRGQPFESERCIGLLLVQRPLRGRRLRSPPVVEQRIGRVAGRKLVRDVRAPNVRVAVLLDGVPRRGRAAVPDEYGDRDLREARLMTRRARSDRGQGYERCDKFGAQLVHLTGQQDNATFPGTTRLAYRYGMQLNAANSQVRNRNDVELEFTRL